MFVLLNTSSLQCALLGPDGPWRAFGPQFYWKSSKYGKKAEMGFWFVLGDLYVGSHLFLLEILLSNKADDDEIN